MKNHNYLLTKKRNKAFGDSPELNSDLHSFILNGFAYEIQFKNTTNEIEWVYVKSVIDAEFERHFEKNLIYKEEEFLIELRNQIFEYLKNNINAKS
jgi:hypothetical protein